MQRHSSLLPLSYEHNRLLSACSYLKKDADPQEGFPLDDQSKYAYIIKVFQELMVPHIQKEEYLFEKCAGKSEAVDNMMRELQKEHLLISQMYITLSDSKDLNAAMNMLAVSLEKHIYKEENEFFVLLQQELPALLSEIQLQN